MSTIEKAIEKLDKPTQADDSKEVNETEASAVIRANSGHAAIKIQDVEAKTSARAEESESSNTVGNGRSVENQATYISSASEERRNIVNLPFDLLTEKGMITPLTPRSRIAEEFRSIKRPLLRNIDSDTSSPIANSNLIMVTSALQGDGKTFNAINLAISIAMEPDKTVLFVDADVSKASAGGLLGVPEGSPGLIDLLENDSLTPADVILQTDIENMRLLPAGSVHAHSTELLASKSMHELMIELSGRYPDRVIIFDSPPLLLTTEASVLASFMGQIAFVACVDYTPNDAMTDALEHIGEDKVIGMILNKAHSRRNNLFGLGARYGYGYGYGYGAKRDSNSRKQNRNAGDV